MCQLSQCVSLSKLVETWILPVTQERHPPSQVTVGNECNILRMATTGRGGGGAALSGWDTRSSCVPPCARVSSRLPLDSMISNQGGKPEGRPTRKMTSKPFSLWKEKNSLSHLLCNPQLGLVTYPACGTPKVF